MAFSKDNSFEAKGLNEKRRSLDSPQSLNWSLKFSPVDRIFWAIDLNSQQTQSTINELKHVLKVVSTLFPQSKIYPAHIIDPEGMAWDGESPQARCERLYPFIESALEEILDQASQNEPAQLAKPFVIEASRSPHQSVHALARRLSSWALKFHADVILTYSTKRSSVIDLLAPSFTDHLLSESKIPLLNVNANTPVRTGPVTDLVFATDFSETCRRTFAETMAWAKHFKASIQLFNKPEATFAPAVYGTSTLFGSGWSGLPPDGIDSDRINIECELWLKQAHEQGVKINFFRDASGLGTAQAISQFCTQFEHPILVMSTCHGPLESGLWGSVTRDVLHQAAAPVLVLRA